MSQNADTIRITVVAPAHNEAENIDELVRQVGDAMTALGVPFEFLIADDASTDETPEMVSRLMADRPWLRIVSLSRPESGGGNGQSVAFLHGFARARGELIAVLDADLQNDPADIGRLLEELERTGADFVQGDRSAARREGDAFIRQFGSIVGRTFRRMILGDTIRDTGCSLRLMKREIALQLPLEFKGMHRFIPVTARQLGYNVVEVPVAHRHRHAGEPKYGMGITKRAIPGLIDCFAVRWMRSRRRKVASVTEPHARAEERSA
ncbi:MAG: glycosyltransferase family 2 protein [Planctomycetota bacterium]